MAWFYNPILSHFFEIGLVAISRRLSGPSASMNPKFALFLGNSQIRKIVTRENRPKSHF